MTTDFGEAVKSGRTTSALHIPAFPENADFINEERLALIPQHAWIINTARGAVVDERALYDAVAAERIGGAASTSMRRSPTSRRPRIRTCARCRASSLVPHIGSNTAEANTRMAERALRNVTLGERGDFAAMDLLNPEVVPGRART